MPSTHCGHEELALSARYNTAAPVCVFAVFRLTELGESGFGASGARYGRPGDSDDSNRPGGAAGVDRLQGKPATRSKGMISPTLDIQEIFRACVNCVRLPILTHELLLPPLELHPGLGNNVSWHGHISAATLRSTLPIRQTLSPETFDG